jgi:hypothetical protein
MEKKKTIKKKDIDWGRIGDPEYLASVTGFKGKVATDKEMCEFFGVEEGKRIYDECFALEPNFGDNALLVSSKNLYKKCIETMKKKNHDYGGEIDPLYNFRNCEMLGVSVPKGILVRMMDKISRINVLLDSDNEVKDESIFDSTQDLVNYCAILNFSLKEQNEHKN